MRELYGKQVFETDEEVLDPRHTALVVVDMQNDFGHPDGHFARAGVDEPVVRKFRSSAFTRTNLDAVLRGNGIETVVVCGCMTEGCVEATARDAGYHDYYVAVAEDAIASNTPAFHDAALLVMRSTFRVRPSAQLFA